MTAPERFAEKSDSLLQRGRRPYMTHSVIIVPTHRVCSQNKFFDGCVPVATGAEIQSGKALRASPLSAKRAIVQVKKR
jgi:hypothetical protein